LIDPDKQKDELHKLKGPEELAQIWAREISENREVWNASVAPEKAGVGGSTPSPATMF
jgi:hypothetical protein